MFSISHSSADSVPRSVLAYFHNAGIEEFKDKKGNSLPMITPHSAAKAIVDPSVDVLSDGPLVIAVQILGHTLYVRVCYHSSNIGIKMYKCSKFIVLVSVIIIGRWTVLWAFVQAPQNINIV